MLEELPYSVGDLVQVRLKPCPVKITGLIGPKTRYGYYSGTYSCRIDNKDIVGAATFTGTEIMGSAS